MKANQTLRMIKGSPVYGLMQLIRTAMKMGQTVVVKMGKENRVFTHLGMVTVQLNDMTTKEIDWWFEDIENAQLNESKSVKD